MKGMRTSKFVMRLYSVLSDNAINNIISWNNEGSMFIIFDNNCFEAEILSVYLNNQNMSSFYRQLHLYGFKRASDSRRIKENQFRSYCCFYHPHFSRDNTQDLAKIRRQTIKPPREKWVYAQQITSNKSPPKIVENIATLISENSSTAPQPPSKNENIILKQETLDYSIAATPSYPVFDYPPVIVQPININIPFNRNFNNADTPILSNNITLTNQTLFHVYTSEQATPYLVLPDDYLHTDAEGIVHANWKKLIQDLYLNQPIH